MNQLVLIRHGQSEWNEKNLFTGWRDPDLTKKGVQEAHSAGKSLGALGIKFNVAFTSALRRAQKTCKIVLQELEQENLQIIFNQALNERDYGDLSGLNKDDARKKWGDEQVHQWRRSYDIPPPSGESLKDTAERVLPYFQEHIKPEIKNGNNILIAAHGNSLRALIMSLEDMSTEEILQTEIETGQPLIYEFNDQLEITKKQIIKKNAT